MDDFALLRTLSAGLSEPDRCSVVAAINAAVTEQDAVFDGRRRPRWHGGAGLPAPAGRRPSQTTEPDEAGGP